MAKIKFQNVNLSYPIYEKDQKSRSLKHALLNISIGGALSKGKFNHVNALNNLSFELNDGDKLGIIGHNGAGKSTLLRTIGRVYTPNSGTYIIDGSVQCLLDTYMGLDQQLSAIENIEVRAALMNVKKKDVNALFQDVAEFSDLGDYLYLPIRTYSTGMLLRLAFGLSTAIPADIIAIDEIVGTGDAAFKERAKIRLKKFMDQAHIIVMCSHDNDYILKNCNKLMWLEHGKMKMLGDAKEVMQEYKKAIK